MYKYITIFKDKKRTQKVWSKEFVYEKTFRLSSSTQHAFTISYELKNQTFESKLLNLLK